MIDTLPLVIDDHAPPPAHTLPNRSRTIKILAVGIVLWILPLLAIVAWRGWGSLHAQEYRFFTQAALVTFGGADWFAAVMSVAAFIALYRFKAEVSLGGARGRADRFS